MNLERLSWAAAGAAFIAYPALRPYADETGLDGLAAMASNRWLLAHLLGMAAFAFLTVGIRSLGRKTLTGRPATVAGPLAIVAVALILPYYGGEAFGLHAIGRYAVLTGDAGLITAVDAFRYQPAAITLFGIGLVLLAVVGVLLAIATWSRGGLLRLAGAVSGLGLLLYLPQFYGTPTMRIAHGVLLGVGCLILAISAPPDPASRPGGGYVR